MTLQSFLYTNHVKLVNVHVIKHVLREEYINIYKGNSLGVSTCIGKYVKYFDKPHTTTYTY